MLCFLVSFLFLFCLGGSVGCFVSCVDVVLFLCCVFHGLLRVFVFVSRRGWGSSSVTRRDVCVATPGRVRTVLCGEKWGGVGNFFICLCGGVVLLGVMVEKKVEGGLLVVSGRSSPYGMSRLAPAWELVDLVREVERADEVLGAVASGQLAVIVEQMRVLQGQARRILERAVESRDLHRVACNFERVPGDIYHLYRRPGGELYFGLLSPEDWGGNPPHCWEGSYRLERDMSWTSVEDIVERDEKVGEVRALLEGSGI